MRQAVLLAFILSALGCTAHERPAAVHNTALHLIGGHVYAFAFHGGRSDLGVFDCL